MTNRILTESSNVLMMETVLGIPLASSLNDIDVQDINKETFSTDPSANGWLIGTDWVWDSVNLRLKVV